MSLTSEVIVLLHAMPHHHQRDSATARRSTDRTSSEEEHNTVTTPIRTLSIRTVLLADAGITGVTGLLMLIGAGPLADLLDLPTALLRGAGIVLIPYVAYLLWLSTRDTAPHQAVWSVIVANIGWAIGCVALLLSGAV